MRGWILYKRTQSELTIADHGVMRLLEAARELKIELSVYKPSQFDMVTSSEEGSQVLLDNQTVVHWPDFVIPRLGAETPYQALMVIRQLEFAGVYCANSAAAIETVKDKMRVSQLLALHQLPGPKTMLLHFAMPIGLVRQEIGFPLVIKNIASARGIGVHLCESASSLQDLLGLLGPHFNQQLLIQQFISTSRGRDLRVLVVGEEIIGCMQRVSNSGFKANYSLGGTVSAFSLTPEIIHLSLACTKLMKLDIAGIDLLFGPKGYLICEANSSPGFKGMELATGQDVALKLLSYVVSQADKRESRCQTI